MRSLHSRHSLYIFISTLSLCKYKSHANAHISVYILYGYRYLNTRPHEKENEKKKKSSSLLTGRRERKKKWKYFQGTSVKKIVTRYYLLFFFFSNVCMWCVTWWKKRRGKHGLSRFSFVVLNSSLVEFTTVFIFGWKFYRYIFLYCLATLRVLTSLYRILCFIVMLKVPSVVFSRVSQCKTAEKNLKWKKKRLI